MPRTLQLLAALCAVLWTAFPADSQKTPSPEKETGSGKDTGLSDDARIHHFLNRFTLGATPALAAEVKKKGMRAWLVEQLKGDREEGKALTGAIAERPALSLTSAEIAQKYAVRVGPDATVKERREARRMLNEPPRQMLDGVLLHAVLSENQVHEVAADFFRNHFAVSIEKGPVALLSVDWEREVIRGRSLGRFPDMLAATAHHPAMLFFLDNHLSCRPATESEIKEIERRSRNNPERVEAVRQRGLNENYARELMELHTLGVDNGYTQDDVIELAKLLTGWTIAPKEARKRQLEFMFVPLFHCAGDKVLLGTKIAANTEDPQQEGEQALKLLAAHEGTASFLAFKLCRWLVNDDPSDALVKRIAKVFKDKQGDIAAVLLAIFDSPEFFDEANYQVKYKRPFEFVVSALRATGAALVDLSQLHRSLVEMNEAVYRCADPTGYYDQAEAWQDPGAMSVRWKFAHDLARGRIGGVRMPDLMADLPEDDIQSWKDILARKLLCTPLSETTSKALDKLIKSHADDNAREQKRHLVPLLVAGILGSPEFQKQ